MSLAKEECFISGMLAISMFVGNLHLSLIATLKGLSITASVLSMPRKIVKHIFRQIYRLMFLVEETRLLVLSKY